MNVPIDCIARDARLLGLEPGESYLLSYPHLVAFLQGAPTITTEVFVVGAHAAYGWMPTILELREPRIGLAEAARMLGRARSERSIDENSVAALAETVNNSVTGVSKLLHFASPETFPIWDSRVFSYVDGRRAYDYRVNSPSAYMHYLALCRALTADPQSEAIRVLANRQLDEAGYGYSVSVMRALELVMYSTGSDRWEREVQV